MPFRRLCLDFGAKVTTSEMAYARQVLRRRPSELALLRKHPSEPCFGVQIAAAKPDEAVQAGLVAAERGAAFVDLNAGCPIHDVVRRGMGATLLQRGKGKKLGRIIEAMVEGLPLPVSVKIRSGWKQEKTNAPEIARVAEEAGAAAVTLHARSREQRYTKAADWDLVARLVEERSIPVIGNGDILTHYEASRRLAESGCASIMVARGALIKPWIFREIEEGQEWLPTAAERISIYRRLTQYMREHFGEDEKGRERTMRFLPWHLGFFCRYRPLPQVEWEEVSKAYPLLQSRIEAETGLGRLDRLLRDSRAELHTRLVELLWSAADDQAAVSAFEKVAEETDETPPSPEDGSEFRTSYG